MKLLLKTLVYISSSTFSIDVVVGHVSVNPAVDCRTGAEEGEVDVVAIVGPAHCAQKAHVGDGPVGRDEK